MGQRILLLLTTLTALFVTPAVLALGLGEVSLQSGLNQPLKAQIQLLQVRDLSKNEILVGLGSAEDFSRIGVDRPYFLTDLKFEVDLENPTGPVINVSSRKAVREPYLNFIVQAQWPSGKLLREYTLLLDLPVFSDSSASSVQGTQTVTSFSGAPAQQPSYQPPPVQKQTETSGSRYNPRSSYAPEGSFNEQRPSSGTSSSSQASSAPPPRLAGADEYDVKGGDTLWEIAAAVRPDRGVSIQQTMLAIQRMNPEAFINNNINLLKKGQILRIPDRDDIAQMSQQAAVREVAVQNNAWSGGSDSYAASEAQLEGSRSYSSRETETTTREGRLKLASPEDARDAREGRGSGSGESSEAVLENELAVTLEELDKTERDNSELRSKISSLEEQIETQERLVEITSEELRQAELAMEKTAQEEGAAEEATTETPTETPSETVTGETPAETGEQPAEETKPEPAPEREVPKVVQPIYEKTIIDHILDNIIYIGIGLLAIVVVVAGILIVRNRANDGFDEEDFLTETSYDKPKSDFDVDAALAEDAENLGDFDESLEQDEAPEEEEHISEAQTEDVVAEADIYIAYGKYDQAEEILLKSLQKDPGNKDARLKLVEVYAALQDGDKFDEHFAILHEIGDEDVIGRAEQLRSGIAGLDVFDPHARGHDDTTQIHAKRPREEAESADDDAMDFSLDLDTEDTHSRGDDDFSLDLDMGDSSDGEKDEFSLEMDADKGGDLDFDLGDFDADIQDDDTVKADADDDFNLDLDDSSTDDGSFDFDLGDSTDDQDGDDDLAIDLDSGEDLDGSFDLEEANESALIEDNLEEDVEPLEFDLSSGDTEVGSTPAVSDDDLSDLDFELDSDDNAGADLEEDTAVADDEDFDLELSDEAIEDLDDMPDLSLDDVSDDDLDPIMGTGSEDLTLISPAVTDADLADSARDDELSVDGDLDLSALDQELDALTGTRGGSDFDEIDNDLDMADEPEPARPRSMQEPVIDFDGLDEDDSGVETEMGEDTMFDQAVNEVPPSDMQFDLPEIDPEMDDDTDLGFLSDSDETATKLDLARAYIDMGDAEGAKDIINEIMKEGNEQQRQEAQTLLKKLS